MNSISIYDMQGRQIQTEKINNLEISLDISNFQQGNISSSGSEGLVNSLIKFFANAQPQTKPEVSDEKKVEQIKDILNEDESDGEEIRSNYYL